MNTPHRPPVSREHVIALYQVMPEVPAALGKTLYLLAASADHRTGITRPGQRPVAVWGYSRSTWSRQVQQLAELGFIEQTQKGSKQRGRAAEYRVLRPAVPGSGTPSTSGVGEKTSPLTPGGEPIRGTGPASTPALTEAELRVWEDFLPSLRRHLTAAELQRMQDEAPAFDQYDRLRRMIVRLISHGHGDQVHRMLTERTVPHQPPYTGARSILAAMYHRTRQVARSHRIDERDTTPAVVEPAQITPAALDLIQPALDAWKRLQRP